ncbi:MAG: hypothetical protein V1672_05315, partial [Candidatus Diapherotrites archaeon]
MKAQLDISHILIIGVILLVVVVSFNSVSNLTDFFREKECENSQIGICYVDSEKGRRTCENGMWQECITEKTVAPPIEDFLCGDSIVEGSEECDSDNLFGETCETIGYGRGYLNCAEDCKYDFSECRSGCTWDTEICDDEKDNDCDGWTDCDDAQCISANVCIEKWRNDTQNDNSTNNDNTTDNDTQNDNYCGNNNCDEDETCETCIFDCGNCETCGNEIAENIEECDGTNFKDQTCITKGFESGTLNCTDECKIDVSDCSNEDCIPENEFCNDGKDNDCDKKIDCEDKDCENVLACINATHSTCVNKVCTFVSGIGIDECGFGANTEKNCSNKLDEDCDGKIDCCDPDCLNAPNCIEICDNKDNDCDGKTDDELTKQCGSNVGICKYGISTCSKGMWGSCIGGIN